MSIFDQSIPITPSRACQSWLKSRLMLAERTLKLSMLKSDSLVSRYREVMEKVVQNQKLLSDALRRTHLSLSKVKFVMGNINQFVIEHVNEACVTVHRSQEMLCGVLLTTFQMNFQGRDNFVFVGLARGGQQVTGFYKVICN